MSDKHLRTYPRNIDTGISGTDTWLTTQAVAFHRGLLHGGVFGRPYKMAAPPEHAYQELMVAAKKGWRRKDLVEAFIAVRETGVNV